MGSKLYIKPIEGALGPGPGGYNADKVKKDNVKFSMAMRLEDLEFKNANFSPGPGRYTTLSRHSIPSMKFGTGARSELGVNKEV